MDRIRYVLDAPWMAWVARVAVATPFLVSGVVKATAFGDAVTEVRALAGEPAELLAALVILTQLGGSLVLLFSRRFAWIGALALAGFTAVATVLGHPFWANDGEQGHRDFLIFLEHIAIAGGIMLAGTHRMKA
jgi:uncharacterized membrane protein YphA (DoxX/SURF4 family)